MRTSILSHLRNLFQSLNLASDILEQAVQIITNDNLDLGCAVIEQAATDKVGLIYISSLFISVFISHFYMEELYGLGLGH